MGNAGRPMSENRTRIREALRIFETESLHALDGEDLARRAKVPNELTAYYVRCELDAALLHMGQILKTLDQHGREASDIWESAIRLNPWPMWWNQSRIFHEPIYVHMTYRRFQKYLGKFGLKQTLERRHKLSLVEDLSEACPALATDLKGSRLALKTVPILPTQTEVKL